MERAAVVRLGLYGALLVAVFAVAALVARVVVPASIVEAWAEDDGHGSAHGAAEVDAAGVDAADVDASGRPVVQVDGFEVAMLAGLRSDAPSSLLGFTIRRDGERVDDLQPHGDDHGRLTVVAQDTLTALRGQPVAPPQTADGPVPEQTVSQLHFSVAEPLTGAWTAHLEFRVDDQVHTASLPLDAGARADQQSDQQHSDQQEGGGHEHR